MMISQEKDFKPLSITFETREELYTFIRLIDGYFEENFRDKDAEEMARYLSNYFTNGDNWS